MIRTRKYEGFTLIEVTLAIVIGIIMIAGATLIYNQAKTSAGNSKANEKVMALQSLIEQYAAQNSGVYPTDVSDVGVLWTRARPDDWNKSPWGGLLGTSFLAAAYNIGVTGGMVPGSLAFAAFAASASMDTDPASGTVAYTTANSSLVGGLAYDYDSSNAIWTYGAPGAGVGDIITNGPVTVKGYAVYIADQQGRFPNFITGGKAH